MTLPWKTKDEKKKANTTMDKRNENQQHVPELRQQYRLQGTLTKGITKEQ